MCTDSCRLGFDVRRVIVKDGSESSSWMYSVTGVREIFLAHSFCGQSGIRLELRFDHSVRVRWMRKACRVSSLTLLLDQIAQLRPVRKDAGQEHSDFWTHAALSNDERNSIPFAPMERADSSTGDRRRSGLSIHWRLDDI